MESFGIRNWPNGGGVGVVFAGRERAVSGGSHGGSEGGIRANREA